MKKDKSDRAVIERSPIDRKIARDTGISLNELDTDRLEKWQLAEIRRLLPYLVKSRHYRAKLAGIRPEMIQTMDDFRRLPLTSEKELAGHETDFLCMHPGEVSRMVTVPTTGTSGGSKRLAFTDRDIARALDFITVAYTTFMHAGDRMMVMMSGGTPGSIGDVVKHSMDQIGAETYIYGPVTDIRKAYEKVLEWKPDVITGIPVQMAALARYSEIRQAQTGEHVQVREMLLSADDVPESVCSRLRRIWGSRVFRHFGMTELCIAGGCECPADMGYHLRHSDHLFEVIDPDENGYGEIAVTTFHHEAMPLLRYRTGDYGRLDRCLCGCGGTLPRLIGPKGRLRNSLDTGHGRIFMRDIEEVLFADDSVTDFECSIVTYGDSYNTGYLLNVTLKHFPGDVPDCSLVKAKLGDIHELTGVRIEVSSEPMYSFERIYNSKKKLDIRPSDL